MATPFQEQLIQRAERAADGITKLWEREQGRAGIGETRVRAARQIAAQNGQAWNLATIAENVDAYGLTGHPSTFTYGPVDPHYTDLHRLHRAVVTATADPDQYDVLMRLARLARAEYGEAGQRGYQKALQADTRIRGWTRGLEPDACQLCRWWWREGRVWPKGHAMPTHPGCMCTPVPSTDQPEPLADNRYAGIPL